MTLIVRFTVNGNPVGKGRPRFVRRGNFVQTYTPQKTKSYEDSVRESARQAMGSSDPLETPISIYLYIRLPIPASYSKKRTRDCIEGAERPTKKPDWDNIAKAVTDALNGICYVDDCQIVDAHVRKVYSVEPGVDVMLKEELP